MPVQRQFLLIGRFLLFGLIQGRPVHDDRRRYKAHLSIADCFGGLQSALICTEPFLPLRFLTYRAGIEAVDCLDADHRPERGLLVMHYKPVKRLIQYFVKLRIQLHRSHKIGSSLVHTLLLSLTLIIRDSITTE